MTDSIVMYALLALDANNEDPLTAQLKAMLPDDQLGDATELDRVRFLPGNYQSAGFYATAYEWNGQTVLSYAGTTLSSRTSFGRDILYGYGCDPDPSNWSMLRANFSGILNPMEGGCHEAEAVFGRADSLCVEAG